MAWSMKLSVNWPKMSITTGNAEPWIMAQITPINRRILSKIVENRNYEKRGERVEGGIKIKERWRVLSVYVYQGKDADCFGLGLRVVPLAGNSYTAVRGRRDGVGG